MLQPTITTSKSYLYMVYGHLCDRKNPARGTSQLVERIGMHERKNWEHFTGEPTIEGSGPSTQHCLD